jgi:dCMP deaminase
MTPRFIDYYMDIAERTAQLSRARRLKVGAIIVKDDRIISIGFNGTPAGWDNDCEDEIPISPWPEESEKALDATYTLKTKPEVIHAESNSISKLARGPESGLDSTMFVTHSPCLDCAKLIYQSGISTVYYKNNYRDSSGVDFLIRCGVKTHPCHM